MYTFTIKKKERKALSNLLKRGKVRVGENVRKGRRREKH